MLPKELRPALTGWGSRTGRKLGFSTPLDDWFGAWLERDAEPFLLGPRACTPDYLDADAVRGLLVEARELGMPRSRQLMSLYVLEGWLRGALPAPP
jgi:hypothetical protein